MFLASLSSRLINYTIYIFLIISFFFTLLILACFKLSGDLSRQEEREEREIYEKERERNKKE